MPTDQCLKELRLQPSLLLINYGEVHVHAQRPAEEDVRKYPQGE